MTNEKNTTQRAVLPEPTLRRLPWYLAYVTLLDKLHVDNVSSTQISKELNVDASQIAKDLSFLNIKGKTRIGYDVHQLVKELTDFLGFKKKHNAIVIGAGSLGAALMNDKGLSQYGLNIVAGFDVNDAITGTMVADTPVYDMRELGDRLPEFNAQIAILTVPIEHSQEAANEVIACGIKAIWNFTPFRIKAPADIVIANTSIYSHLALIYNRMEGAKTK